MKWTNMLSPCVRLEVLQHHIPDHEALVWLVLAHHEML
jgi:hypothetical protein